MTKWLLLLAVLSFGAAAGAAELPNEAYDFLLSKLAAEEGRYDEALERIDSVVSKNPDDAVLLYERALMLIDAGRVDRAESELRTVVQKHPDFYDAQRILGRLLLDRAGNDRAKVDEALKV
ncbi:MAG TPA: tetratricopeptide repeat protein, partial [Thermoanaerobaculia bacterium]|nr:tetratricopeptide repeat protein [Thermoanaerobaculia bacterium]